MTNLKWQDSQQPAQSGAASATPWFAISVGLMGLIVGYALASYTTGGSVFGAGGRNTQQVAQVPTPTPSAPAAPTAPATPATVDDDPILGEEDAPVTLIEFTDYQCPFCGRHFTDTYGQIKKEYIDTGKVKYIVRDYPLSFHPHAQKTAEATECADDQDKFWEMHDKIFETQATWSNAADVVPTLKQYAADLKLNTKTFNDCLDGGTHAGEVQKDMADGSAAGISGTPGFWVLGPDGQSQSISGAVPFANFKQAIDSMLP